MKIKITREILVIGLAIIATLTTFFWGEQRNGPANAPTILGLQPPSFVEVAHAVAPGTIQRGSFLEGEAGISAYTQAGRPIDLSITRDVFRTIEHETPQYIIGSVALSDYTESHDVHVYVHIEGWVVAYYLAKDPAAKIIDWQHYDGGEISSTKLDNALNEILSVVGAVPFEASYYDFRYPDATNIMLIAEAAYSEGSESFDVKLPADFTFYERSWSHAIFDDNCGWGSDSTLYVGDVSLDDFSGWCKGWALSHGTLAPAQLPPEVFNTIRIELKEGGGDSFAGIALVYSEAP